MSIIYSSLELFIQCNLFVLINTNNGTINCEQSYGQKSIYVWLENQKYTPCIQINDSYIIRIYQLSNPNLITYLYYFENVNYNGKIQVPSFYSTNEENIRRGVNYSVVKVNQILTPYSFDGTLYSYNDKGQIYLTFPNIQFILNNPNLCYDPNQQVIPGKPDWSCQGCGCNYQEICNSCTSSQICVIENGVTICKDKYLCKDICPNGYVCSTDINGNSQCVLNNYYSIENDLKKSRIINYIFLSLCIVILIIFILIMTIPKK